MTPPRDDGWNRELLSHAEESRCAVIGERPVARYTGRILRLVHHHADVLHDRGRLPAPVSGFKRFDSFVGGAPAREEFGPAALVLAGARREASLPFGFLRVAQPCRRREV